MVAAKLRLRERQSPTHLSVTLDTQTSLDLSDARMGTRTIHNDYRVEPNPKPLDVRVISERAGNAAQ
jgi:hypothetical protein